MRQLSSEDSGWAVGDRWLTGIPACPGFLLPLEREENFPSHFFLVCAILSWVERERSDESGGRWEGSPQDKIPGPEAWASLHQSRTMKPGTVSLLLLMLLGVAWRGDSHSWVGTRGSGWRGDPKMGRKKGLGVNSQATAEGYRGGR